MIYIGRIGNVRLYFREIIWYNLFISERQIRSENGDIMFEELSVYVILLEVDLLSDSEYNHYLDALFLKNEHNDLLLELECYSSDKLKSVQIIKNSLFYSDNPFDYNEFGQFLFEKINIIYNQKNINIKKFGSKMYAVWQLLPSCISNIEPFWTLSYADDCLSYGDEKQTRELYQKAFKYYSN